MRLKALPLILSFSLAVPALLAAEAKVEVSSDVLAGEPATLTVTVEDGGSPEIERLPKVEGLKWGGIVSVSSQDTIVNFKRSSSTQITLSFVAEKEGSLSIPPLKVKSGKMKLATNPIEVKVEKRSFSSAQAQPGQSGRDEESVKDSGGKISVDDALFMKLRTPEKKRFYVGEEIPVEVVLYSLRSLEVSPSWPELEAGEGANAVFRDYGTVNPKNPKFDGCRQGTEKIGGRVYSVLRFNAAVRALSQGKLSLRALERVEIAVQDKNARRSSFDDDFFFGGSPFSRRSVNKEVGASSETVEIEPLPPAPQDAPFLGLVGNWKPEFSLSSERAKAGEPLTLTLKLRGSGGLETLKAPQFDVPGFRVYPPEVENAGGQREIRYVMIPTEQGETEINLAASTFDCETGHYKTANFAKRLKIAPGSGLANAAGQVVVAAKSGADSERQDSVEQPAKKRAELLYLKKSMGEGVALPLWRNALLPIALTLLAGLAATGALFAIQSRRAALAADPKYARRQAAAGRRKTVKKALEGAAPETLSAVASEQLLPYLSDLLDAAPGAGAAELAERVRKDSPELAGCLEKLGGSAWAPGLKNAFDEDFKKRLLKAFAKLSLCLALCLTALSSAFGADGKPLQLQPLKAAPATLDEAMTAYDAGDFKGAAEFFKSKLNPAKPSPNALYDLGNCLCQLGELPKAMVCYERALRLAPRDSDILENLNFVRRKLDLPERGRIESPADALPWLRDSLRPDEWACLFALGAALAALAFGLRALRRESPVWLGLLTASLALALLSAVCGLWQLGSSYSPDNAAVTMRGVQVRTLPSETAPVSELKPRPGDDVKILERRQGWLRIRSGSAEGWLKSSGAAELWRPDPLGE